MIFYVTFNALDWVILNKTKYVSNKDNFYILTRYFLVMCTQNLYQLSVRTIRGRPRWRRRSSWAPRRSRARLAWRPSRWPCSGWRRSRSASRPRPGARSPQPGTELRDTVRISAANYPSVFTITEKSPTGSFSWLKVATTAFTFKTLLRHYAN